MTGDRKVTRMRMNIAVLPSNLLVHGYALQFQMPKERYLTDVLRVIVGHVKSPRVDL